MPVNNIGIVGAGDMLLEMKGFTPDEQAISIVEQVQNEAMDSLLGLRAIDERENLRLALIDVDKMRLEKGVGAILSYINEFKLHIDISDTYAEIDEVITKASNAIGKDKEWIVSKLENFIVYELCNKAIMDAPPTVIKKLPDSIDHSNYTYGGRGKDTSSQTWKRNGKNVKSYNR